jgi:predicted Zn-dependent protease
MDAGQRDRYRVGVDHLLHGRTAEAVTSLRGLLDEWEGEIPDDLSLALGKALLEAGSTEDALPHFERILAHGQSEIHAYVSLLAASAAASGGDLARAEPWIREVASRDARFEHAARQLARAPENAGPGRIRF